MRGRGAARQRGSTHSSFLAERGISSNKIPRSRRDLGMRRLGERAAFTLVELLVVLVVLGVIAGVSATALPSLLRTQARPSLATRLLAARREAVLGGSAVTMAVPDARTGTSRRWRFLPDGRALGPGLDPRNGAIVDTTISTEVAP